jgi:hypothetical protein
MSAINLVVLEIAVNNLNALLRAFAYKRKKHDVLYCGSENHL